MDLTALTDEELAEHLDTVLNEQERRRRLADAPRQLADITSRFVADGGDRTVAIEAVTDAE